MGLNEAEQDVRFFLTVWAKFNLCSCSSVTGVVRSSRVIFGGSEKAGKVQRFLGHSSQEEQKMVANVGQKNEKTDELMAGIKQKIRL